MRRSRRRSIQWQKLPPLARETQQTREEKGKDVGKGVCGEETNVPSRPRSDRRSLKTRPIAVWAILIGCNLLLALNLFRLQVWQGEILHQRARAQQQVQVGTFVPRRPIADRRGNLLAIDRPAYTLYAHPVLFQESNAAIATRLAPILDRPVEEIIARLHGEESGIRLEQGLSEAAAARVRALYLDGLELIRQHQRLYPYQDLAASVVGYVDAESKGQAGVEYSQEKLLARNAPDLPAFDRVGNGAIAPSLVATETTKPIPKDFFRQDDLRLQLTLDSRLQRVAREALRKQLQAFRGKRGAVVVMDVRDGELLALASEPTYNPNQYYKHDISLFRNWAVADLFEPGSTFKPINIAIALETGAIAPDISIYDAGRIAIGGYEISNYDYANTGGGFERTVTEIIERSSNVGMVRIMERVSPDVYYDWLERIGLGRALETDLPFATPGILRDRESFLASPIEVATTAFGQGFSLNVLQLAQLHAAIANGGKLVMPHAVRALQDSAGNVRWQTPLQKTQRVFSPKTTRVVLDMMERTVEKGTGTRAKISGYRIAGKTGTAQKAKPEGGYYENAILASFVSILPVEKPRYVVLAIVDEPQDGTGGTVAAPIAQTVMESLIAIEGIPPAWN